MKMQNPAVVEQICCSFTVCLSFGGLLLVSPLAAILCCFPVCIEVKEEVKEEEDGQIRNHWVLGTVIYYLPCQGSELLLGFAKSECSRKSIHLKTYTVIRHPVFQFLAASCPLFCLKGKVVSFLRSSLTSKFTVPLTSSTVIYKSLWKSFVKGGILLPVGGCACPQSQPCPPWTEK